MSIFGFTLEQLYKLIVTFIREHSVAWLSAVAFAGGGWWLGKRRARAKWAEKNFLDRLNISLNMIHDGKLLIRTVVEKGLTEVFLNSVAVETVSAAAERTTEASPLLPLPKNDAWYILNSALNEVAEKFSAGEVRRDAGLPVTTQRYVICLTRERAGEMKTQKIRAMLIRKDLLLNLPQEMPQLESPNHATRFNTLQCMAEVYKKDKNQFLELDISL